MEREELGLTVTDDDGWDGMGRWTSVQNIKDPMRIYVHLL